MKNDVQEHHSVQKLKTMIAEKNADVCLGFQQLLRIELIFFVKNQKIKRIELMAPSAWSTL